MYEENIIDDSAVKELTVNGISFIAFIDESMNKIEILDKESNLVATLEVDSNTESGSYTIHDFDETHDLPRDIYYKMENKETYDSAVWLCHMVF